MDRSATCIPARLRDHGLGSEGVEGSRRQNLSGKVQRYLDRLGLRVEDLFHHVLATLHDPAYRAANAGALRMEWPRIPLPGWGDEESQGAAAALVRSAERGRDLARLLNPDTPVPGLADGALRPGMATIAVPATTGGRNMTGEDFAVTAGWGHSGLANAVMPGQGRIIRRTLTQEERSVLDGTLLAGDETFDMYLNAHAFWRNVPAVVWHYKLGGYQVLKKWLSYRERSVLDRALTFQEVQHFTEIARRIAAVLTMPSSTLPLRSRNDLAGART